MIIPDVRIEVEGGVEGNVLSALVAIRDRLPHGEVGTTFELTSLSEEGRKEDISSKEERIIRGTVLHGNLDLSAWGVGMHHSGSCHWHKGFSRLQV